MANKTLSEFASSLTSPKGEAPKPPKIVEDNSLVALLNYEKMGLLVETLSQSKEIPGVGPDPEDAYYRLRSAGITISKSHLQYLCGVYADSPSIEAMLDAAIGLRAKERFAELGGQLDDAIQLRLQAMAAKDKRILSGEDTKDTAHGLSKGLENLMNLWLRIHNQPLEVKREQEAMVTQGAPTIIQVNFGEKEKPEPEEIQGEILDD